MIRAYPDRLSIQAGETLSLHIATDHPELRVAIYRQGVTLALQHDYGWQPARTIGVTEGPPDQAWQWDAYDFPVAADAPSGAYIAMLWERDGAEVIEPDQGVATSVGRFGKALFAVRSPRPGVDATMLYRLPIATYQAYNFSGGASLYIDPPGRVTLHRPGGGTGGDMSDFTEPGKGDFDELDQESSRQTFEHYDAKFIRWLEGAGHRVDYCADTDIHLDTDLDLLAPYGLVLSVGHDEYWSAPMKANLEAYVSQGGNIAFFGANTCWWRITYDDDLTGFACNRDNTVTRPDADQWWVVPRHEPGTSPEDSLTGVSYRNAGGWWWPGRPQIGFDVQRPDHWVFEGGVDPEFGAAQSLIGYECDGAELTFGSGPPGEQAEPTFNGGTPAGFTVLAVGRLVDGFSFEKRDPDSLTAAVAPRIATMGIYTAAGTVFNAAVVDWARVLQDGEPNVDRITRNVLARLGRDPAAPATSTTLPTTMGGGVPNPPIAVAALPPGSGPAAAGLAVVADGAGTIRSCRLDGGAGAGSQLLGPQPDLRDVDAFVSEDDGLAHVIVAMVDGTITDLSFTSTATAPVVTSLELGDHPGVAAVSGFYSGDDEFRHAIVLTDDGTVTEIYFHPVHGIGTAVLGTFPGAIDVASFFSSDDEFRHAIVLTDDGTVTEIYFHQVYGQGRAELATVAGARRVSAHRSGDDPHFDRRVVVTADDGRLHEIRFAARQPIVRSVIANPGPTVDVACMPGAGHRCEVVLARPDGSVDIRAF